MTAEAAAVNPDREGLADRLAAVRTSLSGEAGRYLDNPTTSFFRFVAKDRDKTGPARVGDAFCEAPVPYQILYVEVFGGNTRVPIDVPACRLVEKVLPLTSDFEVSLRGVSRGFLAPVGAFLSAACLTLRFAQAFLTPLIVARAVDRPTFRIGKKSFQAQINASGGSVFERRFRSQFAPYERIPVAVSPAHEVSRFRSTLDRAVSFYLDASTKLPGNFEPLGLIIQRCVVSLAVLTQMYGVPAVASFEARETDRLSLFLAIEGSLKGFVQTIAERLDCGLGDVSATAALEPTSEVIPTEGFAALCGVAFEQFEHLTVNTARFGETGEEQSLLYTVRIETVFEGLVHTLHCTEQASRFTDHCTVSCLTHTAVGEAA